MITIFNRKLLIKDSSAVELAHIKNLLKGEKIPYYLKTVNSRGVIGRALEVGTYYQLNQAYSSDQTYVYFLYVRKKDYEKAKELTSL